MNPQNLHDTAEFPQPDAQLPSTDVDVRIAGLSHVGKVRPNNEDHFLVARFGRTLHTLATNMAADPLRGGHEECGYAMVVADGMGGHAAGEIASASAIENLIELVVGTPDWILSRDETHLDLVMHRMARRLSGVNEQLLQQAERDARLLGMGTTLTLAASLGLDLVLCHIGDSRAYLLRKGTFQQLTRDMTLAQELVDTGTLTPAQAATNRLRHYLTNYLGGPGKDLAQLRHIQLLDGDRILLCSDGLTEMVEESEIGAALEGPASPEDACRELVDLALDGGGRDNVTVVIAQYRVVR